MTCFLFTGVAPVWEYSYLERTSLSWLCSFLLMPVYLPLCLVGDAVPMAIFWGQLWGIKKKKKRGKKTSECQLNLAGQLLSNRDLCLYKAGASFCLYRVCVCVCVSYQTSATVDEKRRRPPLVNSLCTTMLCTAGCCHSGLSLLRAKEKWIQIFVVVQGFAA